MKIVFDLGDITTTLEQIPMLDHPAAFFHFEGYGDHNSPDGQGIPVLFEVYEGELRLLVWADINREDPTHIISLDGARERDRVVQK